MNQGASFDKPIAVGRTAEVYRWSDGWIVKLYRAPWKESAEREARISRAVHAAGLPVPGVGDVVSVDDRVGLLYEYVRGESLLALIRRRPWAVGRHARLLADLHVQIHARDIPHLPAQRDGAVRGVRAAEGLSEAVKHRLVDVIDQACEQPCLCHGDLHPGNVIMAADGPVILDWINTTRGNQFADVARTALLIRVGPLNGARIIQGPLRGLVRAYFHHAYLNQYVASRPGVKARIDAWNPVVAAARLSEQVPGEREWLTRAAMRT